jgi:hypothetical protein
MKKKLFPLFLLALTTACTTDTTQESVLDGSPVEITFTLSGDFTLTTSPFTRSLQADGKDMTDIWILDYVDGTLQQTIHQTQSDTDFGTPTLNLSVGTHHLYFIASRGKTPTLNTDTHTLTFATVSDTFHTDYAITVVPTSNGSRSVTLTRCVTRLRLTITDALPPDIASVTVTPASWYYGIDYLTGEPFPATTSQAITTNIPANYIGQMNVPINIFGFSPTTEWTTNVAVTALSATNTTIGSSTITDAPLMRNRTTEYTGPLFSSSGATTITLSTDWLDSHTATW